MAESASFAIPALAPAPVPAATYGATDFARAIGALLPRGRAWSTDPQSLIGQVLASIAPEFARVQARADTLLVELDPSRATELLPEHEAANGLPDACSPVVDTITNRRAALLAKLNENRGHAEPDYLSILAELGATSAVLYRSPYRVTRAGLARVGDRVQGVPWAFVFAVAYMANLIASPNDQGSGWTTTGGGSWGDLNSCVAPDGATTADKLTIVGSTETDRAITTTAGATGVQWSIWLRSEGGARVSMALSITIGSEIVEVPIEVGSAWRRYVVRAEVATLTSATLRLRNTDTSATARKVWAWGSYAGLISHAVECRMRRIMRAHVEAEFRVVGDAVYASTAPQ